MNGVKSNAVVKYTGRSNAFCLTTIHRFLAMTSLMPAGSASSFFNLLFESPLVAGGETTGQRAAIIYTLMECFRRYGHDPEIHLADILERLPAMTHQDDIEVLPHSRWQPATAAGTTVEVETARTKRKPRRSPNRSQPNAC